jgi:hypothetical protein
MEIEPAEIDRVMAKQVKNFENYVTTTKVSMEQLPGCKSSASQVP